jgi:two-component system, chemotaxis family, protein-glutamate methylesterase/glutaminase
MSFAAAPAPDPSARIRVMVVDDSVVVRGLVSRWIAENGQFEVVASASNGRVALDMLDKAAPDIVLLDIDMPEMDGITTLPRILEKRPKTHIVVVSTLTRRNADISLRCMSLGAADYLPKPESHREVTTSNSFRQELVAKLLALGQSRRSKAPEGARSSAATSLLTPKAPLVTRQRTGMTLPPRCLLIGSSTGGPRAVAQVLGFMGSALSRVPVLIVQHMPPVFTSVFAEHLTTQTGLTAREPQDGEKVQAGTIYVAPGGRHMGVVKQETGIHIHLNDGPAVQFCRPAVDVLFREAALAYGGAALAMVLTGMGSDGTDGSRALAQQNVPIIAQDEATSTVWGMPGSVAKAGLATSILPLEQIAAAASSIILGGASR